MRTYSAKHRFARITPRKARYVMDLVRLQPVEQALETLRFTSRRAAPMISKVIQSALQNAVQEGGAEPEQLVVWRALADDGPTWKRWRPRARGMAYPILKRTSHLSIVLADRAELEEEGSAPGRDRKKSRKKSSSEPAAAAAVDQPEPSGTGDAPDAGDEKE